ncbi:MAG: hypothetical protein WKF84_17505 [Pyrinomonadaceae bacterium]
MAPDVRAGSRLLLDDGAIELYIVRTTGAMPFIAVIMVRPRKAKH